MLQISGTEIAQRILDALKQKPVPKKILAAILVGEDPSSLSFLKQKERVAKELGVDFRLYKLTAGLKNDGLRKEIGKIARLSRVGGVIVQLPLPESINRRYVLNAIPIEKDVDVLSEKAQEAFRTGKSKILPPVVGVVEEILGSMNYELRSMKVAVVGAGFLVGKPIAEWLADKCKELLIFDEGSDLTELKNYDLIISGVGKAGIIKPGMLKEGTGVIDFGYSIEHETYNMKHETENVKKKIYGDFNVSGSMLHDLGFYTPTPGGTGPILVAKLMENFYRVNSIL